MDHDALKKLFDRVRGRSVGILGDFCVDAYWELHPELGEHSIETGIVTTPVSGVRYSPGGAGNIAANLQGLGEKRISCFGSLGADPFGVWLRSALFADFPEGDFMLRVDRENFHTPVYCKPLLDGREQSRFDLGGNPLADAETELLIRHLERALPELDVLIINQQLHNGIHSELFRREFAKLLETAPRLPRIVFDGRAYLDAYPEVILKINAAAASHLAFDHTGAPPEESGPAIMRRTGRELVVTDGENGCFVFEHSGMTHIPAIRYHGPVDTVGAGDSFTAGFALALAGESSMTEAAEFGNACSAVTIRKLAQTGVPTPEELFAVIAEAGAK